MTDNAIQHADDLLEVGPVFRDQRSAAIPEEMQEPAHVAHLTQAIRENVLHYLSETEHIEQWMFSVCTFGVGASHR